MQALSSYFSVYLIVRSSLTELTVKKSKFISQSVNKEPITLSKIL